MPEYLADTMAIVSHLTDRTIGSKADQVFLQADDSRDTIFISVVSLIEILYLSEKKRININPREVIKHVNDSSNYGILSLNDDIVLVASTIDDIRELHDRLIAATAKHYNLPVITNDPVLEKSKHLTTLW